MIYSGKNMVVLGLGHSGEAAATLLLEEGAHVTVCESLDTPATREKAGDMESRGIRVLLGSAADEDPSLYELAVLSPGINPTAQLVQNVVEKKIPLIGELELAFQECTCPVVAITGTNGKTTTTELTEKILTSCGVRTLASGNIGLPFAKAVRQSHQLDVMLLEVSSFQLETIRTFHPKVAAWLNLSPNHLDRYSTVEEYRAAKLRIFENQTADDVTVVNAQADLPPLPTKRITFSASHEDADFTLRGQEIFFQGRRLLNQSDTLLPGIHNAENIMAALGIGLGLNLDLDSLVQAIANHAPPAHRCEFVRDLDGVRWINDSKATNLDAMEKAIISQERTIILIAGGKDKGGGFEQNAHLIRGKVRAAVLIGEMKERIACSWKNTECHTAASLEEAVNRAHLLAEVGDVVLFSPGTSSYDMFRNYVERGNIFKTLVQNLKNNTSHTP